MIYLFLITLNVYLTIFNAEASDEVPESVCKVVGQNRDYGTGFLVKYNDREIVITTAHIPAPQTCVFNISVPPTRFKVEETYCPTHGKNTNCDEHNFTNDIRFLLLQKEINLYQIPTLTLAPINTGDTGKSPIKVKSYGVGPRAVMGFTPIFPHIIKDSKKTKRKISSAIYKPLEDWQYKIYFQNRIFRPITNPQERAIILRPKSVGNLLLPGDSGCPIVNRDDEVIGISHATGYHLLSPLYLGGIVVSGLISAKVSSYLVETLSNSEEWGDLVEYFYWTVLSLCTLDFFCFKEPIVYIPTVNFNVAVPITSHIIEGLKNFSNQIRDSDIRN